MDDPAAAGLENTAREPLLNQINEVPGQEDGGGSQKGDEQAPESDTKDANVEEGIQQSPPQDVRPPPEGEAE